MTTAGVLFIVSFVVALVAVHRPFGDDMYRVVSGQRHSSLGYLSPAAYETTGLSLLPASKVA